MFKSIRIKNFRSIYDTSQIGLADLNVLVGPNNSGKSSILYALMLLKMTLSGKDMRSVFTTCTPELDLGSYLDLVRSGKTNLSITIDFNLDKQAVDKQVLFEQKRVDKKRRYYADCQVEFCYDSAKNNVEVKSFSGRDISGQNILSINKTSTNGWRIKGLSRGLLEHTDIGFVNFLPVIWPRGPEPKEKIVQEILNWHYDSKRMAADLMFSFEDLKYIAPMRERIPRYGIMGTMPYSELGPSGQNLMKVLSTSELLSVRKESVIKELNYWLGSKFKLLRNIHVENVDQGGTIRTLIGDERKGINHMNLASMGFGISQLVPVVVHVVLLPESGCLLVEQPEIHLHPSAQADLADLFIENTKHNRQFIVETHSEHFVLRLRRRIAEGHIKPEKVKVLFVEKERGLTKIRQPVLKSDGHFEEWPEGFFEDGYREALAIAEANHKR